MTARDRYMLDSAYMTVRLQKKITGNFRLMTTTQNTLRKPPKTLKKTLKKASKTLLKLKKQIKKRKSVQKTC
jgi:hypothetical protein